MGTQSGRCYTKSGSVEKYESGLWGGLADHSPVGFSATISKSPDSSGNYEVTADGYDAATASSYSYFCNSIYGPGYHNPGEYIAKKPFYWKAEESVTPVTPTVGSEITVRAQIIGNKANHINVQYNVIYNLGTELPATFTINFSGFIDNPEIPDLVGGEGFMFSYIIYSNNQGDGTSPTTKIPGYNSGIYTILSSGVDSGTPTSFTDSSNTSHKINYYDW